MEDFNYILSEYLSPNPSTRINAENKLNQILLRGDPNDLDLLFESLNKNYDNQVKLFLALLIKKVFESSLNDQNLIFYQEYVIKRKSEIVNTILNIKADLKTVNILVLVLEKCMSLFKENLQALNPEEVFNYIFQFYNFNKENGNIQETFQGLYISHKLLKLLKNWENLDKYDFQNMFNNFYEKIIFDFSEILFAFIQNINNNNLSTNFDQSFILIQYILLYLKIAKHSVNFLKKELGEKIMELTFEFLNKILFNINSIISQNSEFNKNICDSIFISNKILLKYTGYVSKVDLTIIKKFSDLFYVYISDNNIFQNILNIIRMNNLNNTNTSKENKFITDIIDYFKELLQLTTFDNWGDLVLFKNCYSDDSIAISDYLIKDFFTEEKIKNLIIFAIKNCMIFNRNEIEMANNDIEEFYMWYDTTSPIYDLREKAGLLCRIIYDKYKKDFKEFFESLELNLLNLIEKEFSQGLNFDNANLKCALLYFFENLTYIYFNKHRNYERWVRQILLQPLDLNLITKSNQEVFSKFIILRILTKTVDFKEISDYKPEIFMKVYDIFINLDYKKNPHFLLLKFGALDFFYAFFDDYFTKECPQDFLKNSIIHICDMLKNVSTPDIHNKIIKTTLTILDKFKDEEIEFAFPHIFPILKTIWENNWNDFTDFNFRKLDVANVNKLQTSISVVRQNLIKLISVFVKKIGIIFAFNENSNDIVDANYFQFIYNLIGYSISVKSVESGFLVQEALKLILLIQDEFYKINSINKNLSPEILNRSDEFYNYFQIYFKFYDFFPIILDNLTYSDDYFLAQLLITEQYLSLAFLPEVKNFLMQINFVEKLMIIIKNIFDKHITTFPQPIFNFIDFCLFIINYVYMVEVKYYNNYNFSQVAIVFNDFIYNLIQNIFNNINQDEILKKINKDLEKSENTNLKVDFINEEIPEFNIFLGAIQLSNRLIYINWNLFNNFSKDFSYKIANYLHFVVNNKNITEGLSIINRKIFINLIKNLSDVFNKNGMVNEANNLINLLKLFEESNSHFLDQYNHTLNHWLFFFNKMNNNTYYYQFTNLEENLRHYWTLKFEKLNYFEVDLSNINFDFKYFSLLNDEMYKNENNGEEDPELDNN